MNFFVNLSTSVMLSINSVDESGVTLLSSGRAICYIPETSSGDAAAIANAVGKDTPKSIPKKVLTGMSLMLHLRLDLKKMLYK